MIQEIIHETVDNKKEDNKLVNPGTEMMLSNSLSDGQFPSWP